MKDETSAAEVWRVLWDSMDEDGDADDGRPPTPAELRALFDAASRLPPAKLRLLISAVRAAGGH
jgi:hypothetical protein